MSPAKNIEAIVQDISETIPGQLDALDRKLDAVVGSMRLAAAIRDSEVQRRFELGEMRFASLDAGLLENTQATKRIEASVILLTEKTQDLVDFSADAKGATKVLNMIAALAKPISTIMILIGLLGAAWEKFRGWWYK